MQQQYSSAILMHSNPEEGDGKRGINNKMRKELIKYMGCQKNHAAGIGGHSTDGCGEFMTGGEEGTTMEAMKCAACSCHRNFHKRLVTTQEPEEVIKADNPDNNAIRSSQEKYIFGLRLHASPPKARTVEKKEVSRSRDDGDLGRKRHMTKFSPEQKEKMRRFAERVGWRIQRVDESTVNQFCQEIGIKRRVFKVWMHNKKYTLANKKSPPSATSI